MSAKPETQGERAELAARLNALSTIEDKIHNSFVLTSRDANVLRRAAALLADDGKAAGEVVKPMPFGERTPAVMTYADQPGNVGAWRLGEACKKAAAASAGDYIDRGLGLLKELQAQGYGVVHLSTTRPQQAAQVAQPLTPERIMEIAREAGFNLEPTANWLYTVRGNAAQVINAIRLAEAAHGIGKDQAS